MVDLRIKQPPPCPRVGGVAPKPNAQRSPLAPARGATVAEHGPHRNIHPSLQVSVCCLAWLAYIHS